MVSLASVSGILEACVRRYVTNEGDIYGTLASLAAESEPGAGGLKIDPLGPQDAEEIARYPKPHIARAIMEGTVAHLARRIREMKEKGISATEAVMVGGPSETPLWAKLIEEQTGLTVTVKHGAFAGAVAESACEAVVCGHHIGKDCFEPIADACITRYYAAGLCLWEAAGAADRGELPLITDYEGGTGCGNHDRDRCAEHLMKNS